MVLRDFETVRSSNGDCGQGELAVPAGDIPAVVIATSESFYDMLPHGQEFSESCCPPAGVHQESIHFVADLAATSFARLGPCLRHLWLTSDSSEDVSEHEILKPYCMVWEHDSW
jgi:hypothetical protein